MGGTNYLIDTRPESQVTVNKQKQTKQQQKKAYSAMRKKNLNNYTNYRLKLLGNDTEINKDFHVSR